MKYDVREKASYRINRKAQIVAMAQRNPAPRPAEIAEAVGVSLSYVCQVLRRTDCHQSIFALGRAARDAGLTLQDIRAIAMQRSAA